MPRLTVPELEARIREQYSDFSHVEEKRGDFTTHHIGRWGGATMNSSNEIGHGGTYREALASAVWVLKEEAEAAARARQSTKPELAKMLLRLTEKGERLLQVQHTGAKVPPKEWSGLYTLTNEARALLARN